MCASNARMKAKAGLRLLTGLTLVLALLVWTVAQVVRAHGGDEMVRDYHDLDGRPALTFGDGIESDTDPEAMVQPDAGGPVQADAMDDHPTSQAERGAIQGGSRGESALDALLPVTARGGAIGPRTG